MRKGRIDEFNPEDKKALFIKACNMGSGLGCKEWGRMIEDEKEALKFYQKGCDLGSGWGCQHIANHYLHIYSGSGMSKEARVYYEKACELKDFDSCEMLLFLYKDEIDIDKIEKLRDESNIIKEKQYG